MKPVVRFKEAYRVVLGKPAYVFPIDHPSPKVSNTKFARTSEVVSIIDEDHFETLNTTYVKATDEPRSD